MTHGGHAQMVRDFREALREVIPEVFQSLLQECGDQTLYSFGLYTMDDGGFAGFTANTEEGLSEAAAEYSSRGGADIESERAMLRWSPCDAKYHNFGEQHAHELDQILHRYNHNEDDDYPSHWLLAEMIHALSDLDQRGAFGRGSDRPFLLVWMGDQSGEQRIEWAKLLNDFDRVQQFMDDLEREEEEID